MAKYKKIKVKTVEEWLEIRRPRLGGSEIASVIHINPWESRYELYLRKRGEAPDKEENDTMLLGHLMEDVVAQLLQKKLGIQIIKNTSGNLIYLSEDYPFAEASPDRLGYPADVKKSEDNKIIVEIKTTQKTIDEEDIPAHWICQVMWYMGITGYTKALIAWLTQGRTFGYKWIDFDQEFFNMLAEEGRQFMEDVKNGNTPEAVTAADVASRYPTHTPDKQIEVNESVALACEKYKELKKQIKDIEAELEPVEEMIKVAIMDAESITYGGLTLATYKASKDSLKFDKKLFESENPELLQKYTKLVPSGRRLNVK